MRFELLDIRTNYIKFFLIFGWIACWVSLSFNPEKFFLLKDFDINKINFIFLFDLSRGIFQILYLPALIIVFFNIFKKKYFLNKFNFFFILLVIFFLIQLIGLFNSFNSNSNSFFIISALNTVLICFLFKIYFSEKDLIVVLKLTIGLLLLILFFYGAQYFYVAIKSNAIFYNTWGKLENSITGIPRPTGLARTALIILIFFTNAKSIKESNNKFFTIISIISSTMILILSSRTILFLFFLYLLFYVIYFNLYKLKDLSIILKNFIIIPFLIIFVFGLIQNLVHGNKYNLFFKQIVLEKIFRKYPTVDINKTDKSKPPIGVIYKDKNQNFSSGRIRDWNNIILLNKNKYFGYGVMGDRYLINQSASNILLYSYASCGILGVILIIVICLKLFFYSLKKIFYHNKNKLNNFSFISSLIIISLLLRSILETSFGVFGIDLMLFCLCAAIITKKMENKK